MKIKGQRVFLYVKACPLYNSDGAITGAIESIRDITELKESAQKVEESRAKYKFLAEHSRDAIVIVAHDNTILYINATGVQLLEEDSIEAVLSQKNLMRYIHPDSADLFVYDSEQIKIGNEGYIAKYKLITAKEREIWVESQGLNIPYKDGRALFISLRDITQRKQIEEEREVYLQNALAQENFTRALLDALPIPVLWKDTQLRYLGCNAAYSRLFGVDKEYVTGKTAEEIWSDPRDAHAIREHDLELLKSRKIRPFQRKITDKNGKTHDIVVYKSIFSDHEGNVAGIVGAMQDMSEYKQMLGDLKKQEELFRMMVTQSSDVFIIISPDYDITYISPNYSCIAGFLSEEVIGPALRLIHPDDRATVLECFERLKQNVSFIETAEFRSMKRDGSYVLLEGVGVNCIDNPAIRGILITARDITARKRVEERLSVITRLFENISSSTPIYVALLDHEGYILFSNRSFRAGYEDAERVLPRMRIQDCFAPDWEEECSQVLRYTIEHGQSSVHECRIYADSKDTVISAAFFPICEGEKRFVGFIGLDVTEQKRLQYQFSESVSQRASLEEEVKKRTDEITELLSLKESLITAIAHDLRTPLTPLVALLPVLEYEDDYQKRGEIIRLLQKSANQIALIVQNLLQMNALKPGFLREDVSDINLKEAIHNVLPVHMILAEQKGVRIEPDIPEGVVIRSSLPHLISIIDNIIANAVKFSRSGGTVQIHVQDQGEVVHISVQDDGLGIPQQDLARVFEPFFKVDRSRHDRSSLGLGLSVTKRLVQVIGGTISIQSQGPATGTVVEITVPKVIDKMEGWGVFG